MHRLLQDPELLLLNRVLKVAGRATFTYSRGQLTLKNTDAIFPPTSFRSDRRARLQLTATALRASKTAPHPVLSEHRSTPVPRERTFRGSGRI